MEDNRDIEIHNGKTVVKSGINDAEGRARILELFGKNARPKVDNTHTRKASAGKNSWDKAVNKAITAQNAAMQRVEEERKAEVLRRERETKERWWQEWEKTREKLGNRLKMRERCQVRTEKKQEEKRRKEAERCLKKQRLREEWEARRQAKKWKRIKGELRTSTTYVSRETSASRGMLSYRGVVYKSWKPYKN